MEIKRRDLLGMGAALGVGMAANGVMGQEAPSGGRTPQRLAASNGDFASTVLLAPVSSHTQPSSVDLNYKPRRVNKTIELWEDGQPIYYHVSGMGPGVDSYAQGVRMAQTYADAINVEMEHGALDFVGLREFMRGLVDGGPTRSGHRTPAVFVETGTIGLDAAYMRANTWVLQQFLDAGVHGIHICHSRKAEAVEVASQMAMRYPFSRPGIPALKYSGLRGSSPGYAAEIWGVEVNKYLHIADLWPLNPKGEVICGVKIEDTFADQDQEQTLALPGIAFAEYGGGDHLYSLFGLSIFPEDGSRTVMTPAQQSEAAKVRQTVLDNCNKNHVMFLDGAGADPNGPNYVVNRIKEGVKVLLAGEEAAIAGREYTKRKMPV